MKMLNESLNISNKTFDIVTHLTEQLGERYLNNGQLVVLNIVYIAIFVSGLVGNICTCIVIARNRNMHTATNYYLVSLAITDITTLIIGENFYFALLHFCGKKNVLEHEWFMPKHCASCLVMLYYMYLFKYIWYFFLHLNSLSKIVAFRTSLIKLWFWKKILCRILAILEQNKLTNQSKNIWFVVYIMILLPVCLINSHPLYISCMV